MAIAADMKRKIIGCLGIIALIIALLIAILIAPGLINFYFIQNGAFDRSVNGKTSEQAEQEIEKLLSGKSCQERKIYLVSKSFKKIDTNHPDNYFERNSGEYFEYVIYDYLSFIAIPSARIQFNIVNSSKCTHRVTMQGI